MPTLVAFITGTRSVILSLRKLMTKRSSLIAGHFLRLDADDPADAMRRIDDVLAGLEVGLHRRLLDRAGTPSVGVTARLCRHDRRRRPCRPRAAGLAVTGAAGFTAWAGFAADTTAGFAPVRRNLRRRGLRRGYRRLLGGCLGRRGLGGRRLRRGGLGRRLGLGRGLARRRLAGGGGLAGRGLRA